MPRFPDAHPFEHGISIGDEVKYGGLPARHLVVDIERDRITCAAPTRWPSGKQEVIEIKRRPNAVVVTYRAPRGGKGKV